VRHEHGRRPDWLHDVGRRTSRVRRQPAGRQAGCVGALPTDLGIEKYSATTDIHPRRGRNPRSLWCWRMPLVVITIVASLVTWSGPVAASGPAETWTIRTPSVDGGWRSITYGNGLFVAVASSGQGYPVMTSSAMINPAFSDSTSTADGFTVDITNYHAGYTWTPSPESGAITTSTASGSALPLTITGSAQPARVRSPMLVSASDAVVPESGSPPLQAPHYWQRQRCGLQRRRPPRRHRRRLWRSSGGSATTRLRRPTPRTSRR